jgi:hypothetical protein
MFSAICFRGRHPNLPRNIIANTAKSQVMPSLTTGQLRESSLTQLALRLRKILHPYDEEHVAKVVAHEFKSVRESNGKITSYPISLVQSRRCGAVSLAKLGLSSPNFGEEDHNNIISVVQHGRGCATIVDSKSGDWTVDFRLNKRPGDI